MVLDPDQHCFGDAVPTEFEDPGAGGFHGHGRGVETAGKAETLGNNVRLLRQAPNCTRLSHPAESTIAASRKEKRYAVGAY